MVATEGTNGGVKGGVIDVEPAELKRCLDMHEALVIDVREPDEHAREHITGALLMPLSTFDPQAVVGLLGRKERVVLHCRGGGRSRQAAERLLAAGASEVAHLRGGIAAWIAAGLSVERNEKAPLPLMRQVQIVAGTLVFLGTMLGITVHGSLLFIPAFVGAGLTMAGITGNCPMANLLAKMPWNRGSSGFCMISGGEGKKA